MIITNKIIIVRTFGMLHRGYSLCGQPRGESVDCWGREWPGLMMISLISMDGWLVRNKDCWPLPGLAGRTLIQTLILGRLMRLFNLSFNPASCIYTTQYFLHSIFLPNNLISVLLILIKYNDWRQCYIDSGIFIIYIFTTEYKIKVSSIIE